MATSPFSDGPSTDVLYTTTVAADEHAVTTISRAITEVTGADVTDRDPLYEHINPDLLDAFIRSDHTSGDTARIVFTAWGFEIVLFAGGTLHICSQEPVIGDPYR